MPIELPDRSEVDDSYKWSPEDIYNSTDVWEEEFGTVRDSLSEIKEIRKGFVDSGQNLLTGLEKIMAIEKKAARLSTYAHLRRDENTRKQKFQELYARAQDLNNEINRVTSFMMPAILSLTEEQIQEYLSTTPGLEKYEHLLQNIIRQKEHYLSEREEEILALAGDLAQGPDNIFTMLNDADITFPIIKNAEGEEVRLTHGRFLKLMKSRDRRVRKEAFTALYGEYEKLINTFGSTLNTTVKADVFYKEARNYKTSLAAALDKDKIPVEVYHNLINTVKEKIGSLHKYITLRKEMLDLDELHMYDIYTPLIRELDYEIEFDEARERVLEGLQPLGEEYISLLKRGFSSGWIDVYENQGKKSGAYSSGCYDVHPYILLNYNRDIEDLFTLAHELGHALHSYYTNKSQPFVYSGYSIFVAEVASTLNEILLMHYLLENIGDVVREKYLINYFLEQFRGTVFRQTMFAEFEKIIHEKVEGGRPLTPELLNKTYYKLNEEYYGSDIQIDNEISFEWARIPHFYYNFYVYQYATGFSAATALARKIISEGAPAVHKYIDFLRGGNSDYPLNLLQKAGVDLHTPQPIAAAVDVFAEYVDKLESLT